MQETENDLNFSLGKLVFRIISIHFFLNALPKLFWGYTYKLPDVYT